MDQGDGCQSQSSRHNTITPRTLRRVEPSFTERQRSVPRIRDIWIPRLVVSPNHFVRLYIPGVEGLFQAGDRLLRVEHSGSKFRFISWRIWRNQEEGWQFNKNPQMSKVSPLFHLILYL